MLNKFLKSALILFILTVLLTGCVFSAKEYSVEITFTVDGAVYLKKVFNRSNFEFPEEPTKEGFMFAGWYLDKEFKEEFVGLGSLENGASAVLYAEFRCLHENIINKKLPRRRASKTEK